MANAFYYASQFQSNGTATAAPSTYFATVPPLARGRSGFFDDYVTLATVLATTDAVYLARLPAGHIPLKVELDIDGDLDTSGTTLAVKIGTTADDDLVVAAAVISTADAHYEFPTNTAGGSVFGNTTSAKALRTTAPPSTDYNLIMVPTAAATGTPSGNAKVYIRVHYGCPATVYDDSNSPAVVAGTQ